MYKIIFILLFFIMSLTGCYQTTINQGSIINKKEISMIKLNMGKDQVRHILGEPILNNNFEKDTWIYVHTCNSSGKTINKNKLILKFNKNRLVKIYK